MPASTTQEFDEEEEEEEEEGEDDEDDDEEEEEEEDARRPPPARTTPRTTKLDATIPKMYCSMIHSSVVVAAGTAAGGTTTTEEEEEGTTTTTTTNGNTPEKKIPTHQAAHHPDVHRHKKSSRECHAAFGPVFRRVWVQGEVTKSIENGATLTVDDGTGRVDVHTDGERKIERGSYVCVMGLLDEEKSVRATHVMEIADAKVRRSREQAWAMEVRELWDGIRSGVNF